MRNRRVQNSQKQNDEKFKSITLRATKRLLMELADIEKNPLPGIGVLPVKNNMFHWHANLAGPKDTPWEGAIFHVEIFPSVEYPNKPPTLRLLTRISHPSVDIFGNICMPILDVHSSDPYQRWSPAYTIKSVLLQFQAAIFESNLSEVLKDITDPKQYEKAKKEWMSGVQWAVDQSRNYINKSVGHLPPTKPWPPIPSDETKTQYNPEDDYVCFFTKQSYKEVVLGYGFSFSKNIRTGDISAIRPQIDDYISLKAFMNSKIRESSTKETFTHFIPIYIDETHGKKAMYLAKRALSIVTTGSHDAFDPMQAIFVLPKLMNTMVVSMMTGNKVYSTRALIAYSHFHRLLVQFLLEYPQLQEIVNNKVKAFIEDGQARMKGDIPNLGDFLAMVSVSKYSWEDIQSAYLNESFTRQVLWTLKAYPDILQEGNAEFMNQYFQSSATSLKLLLFQSYFLRQMSKPFGKNTTLEQLATFYDKTLAIPSAKMESDFLHFLEEINAIENYEDFYQLLKLPYNEEDLIALLKDSIIASEAKGYHGAKSQNILSPEEYSRQTRKFDIDTFAKYDENTKKYTLLEDDTVWKEMCEQRWGFNELPSYLESHSNPWRKLYLQNNLQDLISNLNEYPDFVHLHKTCDISTEIPRIEILMFEPTNIKSRYFFLSIVLSKLTSLNTLIIKKGSTGLSKIGFKALAKGLARGSGALENLILEHCGITSHTISELTSGEHRLQFNLKRLSLANNPLQEEGGRNLGLFLRHHDNFPELEELDLSGCELNATAMEYISSALITKRKLKRVILRYNPCGDGVNTVLYNLSFLSTICDVDISGSGALNANRLAFKTLMEYSPSVTTLNLFKVSAGRFSDVGSLRMNTTLRVLDLACSSFAHLFDLGRALACNTTLKELYLDNNRIATLKPLLDGFLAEFADQKSICHQRNPEGIIHLEVLTLSENPLNQFHGKDEQNYLKVLISKCKKLRELNLKKTSLKEEVFAEFAEVLEDSYGIPLKKIDLRESGLSTVIKPFTSALSKNKSVEVLDISGNALGVKGAALIAEVLQVNNTLKEVNLFGNFIEIEGCEAIAKALETNKSIEKIDLGLNRIRERGCKALIESIKSNTSLKSLLLKHNHLADSITLNLAKVIANQSQITSVSLAGNFLTPRIRAEIALILGQANRSITFDLSNLVRFKDPENLSKSIIITEFKKTDPVQLALNIKKSLYKAKVGAISNVHVIKRRNKNTMYAFVEFAHPDSVQVAIEQNSKQNIIIDGIHPKIARAGINETKANAA